MATNIHQLGATVLAPVARRASKWRWLAKMPLVPRRFDQPAVWPEPSKETPESLRTVPGAFRDPDAETAAYEDAPLYHFAQIHTEAMNWLQPHTWDWGLPSLPRRLRSVERTKEVAANNPVAPPPDVDAQVLTDDIRAEARRLGISAIGIAPYDPKFIYKDFGPYEAGSVIVCILEQDWELTQQIPSGKTERYVMRVYTELGERACNLAEFVQSKGFRAEPQTYAGEGIYIHYAVEAGLGQLGINGQLLTPQAGSRCRITIITTNASLVSDAPVDYGINAICDECQICVRRCPPGAIPNKRTDSRGVMKAKLKPERCLPVMAQAHGCAVCMKVCPVQRYGLDAVKAHWTETGEILGKGTDELEGYHWVDGRHYGPGEKPRLEQSFVSPPGFYLDAKRKHPPGSSQRTRDELTLTSG